MNLLPIIQIFRTLSAKNDAVVDSECNLALPALSATQRGHAMVIPLNETEDLESLSQHYKYIY
jgi:hypothetical protein